MHTTLIAVQWEAAYFATEVYRLRSESLKAGTITSDQWERMNVAAIQMHAFLTNPTSWADRAERWTALAHEWARMGIVDGDLAELYGLFRAAWVAAYDARHIAS